MPTLRPRHMITETADVERAIDDAALIWPELRDDRAALLRKLIDRGTQSVLVEREALRAGRRAAIRETSGMFSGVWPADAVQRMREEWPE